MDPADIKACVGKLDTNSAGDAEEAWALLKPLGAAVAPYLAEAYPTFRKAPGRVSLLFHCIRYARISDDAYQLGILALKDKATLVRYRACGLLAYSLRKEALPYLKALLDHPDKKTAEDAAAAIDAIKKQNHPFFIDRNHSGRAFWQVNENESGP